MNKISFVYRFIYKLHFSFLFFLHFKKLKLFKFFENNYSKKIIDYLKKNIKTKLIFIF